MTQMRTIESVPFATDLAAALATPGTDAMRVAEDFFGLADLFKENTRLARALTDPARSWRTNSPSHRKHSPPT